MTKIDLVRLPNTIIYTCGATELSNKYFWGYTPLTAESKTLKITLECLNMEI